MKKIIFTVTNDLSFDQRMQRICSSLATAGYEVTLVGRELNHSGTIGTKCFHQHRLRCFFNKGFLFYAEFNLRLFSYLLTKKVDALCAIDLDTIVPVFFASKLKSLKRIYDAHEYFTEMKEVRTRPFVYRVWKGIESFCVPRFRHAYTVSDGLAKALGQKYGVDFITISNFPVLNPITHEPENPPYLFFGGAVNEARAFEYLVPAMQYIDTPLIIAGDGNFMPRLKALLRKYNVENKVALKGMVSPQELRVYAEKATLGMGLAEREGINQFWALPNKFTDYIHAGLPQITMNFPEYVKINNRYKVAVLIDDLDPHFIAETINATVANTALLTSMRAECIRAREVYNWKGEEKKLIQFYESVFNG